MLFFKESASVCITFNFITRKKISIVIFEHGVLVATEYRRDFWVWHMHILELGSISRARAEFDLLFIFYHASKKRSTSQIYST